MNPTLYKIYKITAGSTLPYIKKKIILRSLFASEPWAWRVEAISHSALLELARDDFKKLPGKYERHHPIPFANTAQKLLCVDSVLTFEEWKKVIRESEHVHLIRKYEHKTKKYIEYKIKPKDTYFLNNGLVGFQYGQSEKDFLKELIYEHRKKFKNQLIIEKTKNNFQIKAL